MHRLRHITLAFVLAMQPFRVVAQAPHDETIRKLAQEMAEDARTLRYDKFVRLLYPRLIEYMGGYDKAQEFIQKGANDLAIKGFHLASTEIGQPYEPVSSGSRLFVIVPEVSHIIGPKAKVDVDGYLLAVSEDGGTSWTFISGSDWPPDRIKFFLPDLPHELILPERKSPKVTPLK